jgi:hypothetical protein
MPMARVSGPSTGARMISEALMSMNRPTNSNSRMINPMITAGFSEIARKPVAMSCGIWLKVIHQPRMVAEAMIRNRIAVTIDVRKRAL